MLRNYGVKVTIIEFLDRALPNEDADVSKEITRQYKKYGVDDPHLDQGRDGRRQRRHGHRDLHRRRRQPGSIEADKVLMSIGFAPNVEGFGLENTGVKLTDRGAIEIDELHAHQRAAHLRDRRRHREAQLAHVAEAQGVVAAETIGKAETMALGDYRMMPRATFCSPQVA